MSRTTISDLARRAGIVLAIVAMVAAAAALAGCGGTVESPGGPSGTGAPASMEKLAASAADQAAATAVLAAAGITTSNSQYLQFEYTGADKATMVVTGPQRKADGSSFTSVTLVKQDAAWVVAGSK
jgi:hypothetical protein